jgi:ribosomal protein S18 acetylase RimI-like enzyme
MSINIRRAKESDTDKIKDLLSQVLEVHHSGRPDLFKANCRKYTDSELDEIIKNDTSPIFVAENDGNVLGYCFCIIKDIKADNILTDHKALYIDDLCIDQNSRGQKIGTLLYNFVKGYAKDIDCYNITLNVWECNPTAKRFYEKLGLIPQKTVMEYML